MTAATLTPPTYLLGDLITGRALMERGFRSARGVLKSTRTYKVVGRHVDVTTWLFDEQKLYLAEVIQ